MTITASLPSSRRRLVDGALFLASLSMLAFEARAQSAQELPPLIVEGASISVRPIPKRSAEPAVAPASQPGSGGASGGAGDGVAASDSVPEQGILVSNQGTAVTIVTADDMRRQQIKHAADALRSLPGVSVSRSGGPQSITSVRLRGAESNHTLVLIDGVEVNGTDASFDFALLTVDDIERIEILRGPQSALYSSGAVGGAINIITKSGKGPLTVRVRAEAGTMNTQEGSVQISAGNDRAHGILTLYGKRTDGFNLALTGNEDDAARFSNFSLAGGVQVLPGLKVDATLRRSGTRADRDDFDGTDAKGFSVLVDTPSRFTTDLWLSRVAATLDTLDGRWVHKFHLGGTETNLRDAGRGVFPSFTDIISNRVNYGYVSTYRIESAAMPGVKHFVTGLIDQERESFDQPSGFDPKRERNRTGVAGELRGEYFNSLFLAGTVRRDDNDKFEDFTSWQASAAFKVPQTPFRLHSTVGTGVKYPSLIELFGEFGGFGFTPNPNLIPEESFGWDTGIETTLFNGRAVVDVTYFKANLENEIETIFNPVYSVRNRTGESTREGVEVAARLLVGGGLTLGGSYTYLLARQDDGSEEIRRPPHAGRIDANYLFADGRANLNLAAAYSGRMFDSAFNNNTFQSLLVPLEPYWLLSAAASYKIRPDIELYGRVENILDESYQEVYGINSAPVAAYAGVRFTYGGKP